jgi:hypothetical protein
VTTWGLVALIVAGSMWLLSVAAGAVLRFIDRRRAKPVVRSDDLEWPSLPAPKLGEPEPEEREVNEVVLTYERALDRLVVRQIGGVYRERPLTLAERRQAEALDPPPPPVDLPVRRRD